LVDDDFLQLTAFLLLDERHDCDASWRLMLLLRTFTPSYMPVPTFLSSTGLRSNGLLGTFGLATPLLRLA
jgi:hypothetical protein